MKNAPMEFKYDLPIPITIRNAFKGEPAIKLIDGEIYTFLHSSKIQYPGGLRTLYTISGKFIFQYKSRHSYILSESVLELDESGFQKIKYFSNLKNLWLKIK